MMNRPKLNYLGNAPTFPQATSARTSLLKRLPLGFTIVVVVPTLLASIYYLGIASPRYVSEARFIVRAQSQQPSSLGMALQGVGLAPVQTDSFAVHEYISSRDGLKDLSARLPVADILRRPEADSLSRYPRFWDSATSEGLYKGYKRFLTVGYNSTNGISVLRVEAFRPKDAQAMTEGLLLGGEQLVNRLNQRAENDALIEAQERYAEARERLSETQRAMATFRNREGFINPTITATESSRLIGGLAATLADLKAQRSQLVAEAPNSPQLPSIDGRIAAFERQIAAERSNVAGTDASLAPKVGAYEALALDQELADRELSTAAINLSTARRDAGRQKLYLERISNPSLPDEAAEPRRWKNVFVWLICSLLAYGIGWLIWAGVREHRQD